MWAWGCARAFRNLRCFAYTYKYTGVNHQVTQFVYRHIDAVFAPGQAALQQQETRLHLEYQGAAQDNPQEIDIFLDYFHKIFIVANGDIDCSLIGLQQNPPLTDVTDLTAKD